jgi:predicted nucleic acid-binding protein
MRFWDSSAIVPLVCLERTSQEVLKWYREDPQILVWALTSTEVLSALYRRFREGRLTSRELSDCCQQVHMLREDWSEVEAVELVKQRAERLLRVHPLRAADALQLGAALLATQEQPQGIGFVSYDQSLAAAAHKEGFAVLSAC